VARRSSTAPYTVEYQGFEALVGILTGEVSEGRLPIKAAAIVKEWCLQHQEELLANWERGQRFEPMERIPGADQDRRSCRICRPPNKAIQPDVLATNWQRLFQMSDPARIRQC
jgi:hypothetical protein